MYIVLAEEVVIEVDELHLPHCREELTLLHGVEHVVNLQFLPSASHGTTRDEYNVIVVPTQPSNLIYKGGHAGNVELASVCGKDIAAHFHYNSSFHLFTFLPFQLFISVLL